MAAAGARLASLGSQLGGRALQASGAFALGRISSQAKEAEQSVSALEDAFRDLDYTAKSATGLGLMVDELQALQTAADLSGLDNLERSLLRVQARLGEAVVVGGRMREVFQGIGLDVNNLVQQSPVEVWEETLLALEAVENQYIANYYAQQLVGRAGLQGIRDNIEALREFQQFQEEYGLGLSEEQASLIEDRNDSFVRLGAVMQDIANEAAVEFAPAMISVAESLTEIFREGGVVRTLIDGLINFAAGLADSFAYVAEKLEEINAVANATPQWVISLATASVAGLGIGANREGSAGDGEQGGQPGFGAPGSLLNVGAALAGSVEAFSTIYSQRTGDSAASRTADATEETAQYMREIAAQGRRLGYSEF